jgi:WD40 repeat protein
MHKALLILLLCGLAGCGQPTTRPLDSAAERRVRLARAGVVHYLDPEKNASAIGRSEEPPSVVPCKAAFSADGKLLLVVYGYSPPFATVWEVASGRALRTFLVDYFRVTYAAFRPDGRTAVVTHFGCIEDTRLGVIELWDVTTGRLVRKVGEHPDGVESASLSGDGKWLVTSDDRQKFKLWDLVQAAEVRTVDVGRQSGVWSVAIAPNGRQALASYGGALHLWDMPHGQCVRALDDSGGVHDPIVFSPDGRQVLGRQTPRTAHGPFPLLLWDVGTGALLRRFLGHDHMVLNVAFIPGERQVLSGGADSRLKAWDCDTGLQTGGVEVAADAKAIAFSADGRLAFVASGMYQHDHPRRPGNEITLQLWDVSAWRLLWTVSEPQDVKQWPRDP